jgi:hypothetical protein
MAEFNHRADEMRAFGKLLDRPSIKFELFAASHDLAHVVFRRVETGAVGSSESTPKGL